MCPVKAGKSQQLPAVVSILLPEPQSCPLVELLENTAFSKDAGFGNGYPTAWAVLLSANFTKTTTTFSKGGKQHQN